MAEIKRQKGKRYAGEKSRQCQNPAAIMRVPDTQKISKKNGTTEYWTALVGGGQGQIYGGSKKGRSRSANSSQTRNGRKQFSGRALSPEWRGEDKSLTNRGSPRRRLPGEKDSENIRYQLPSYTGRFDPRGRRYRELDFSEEFTEVKKTLSPSDSRTETDLLRKEIQDWKIREALTNRVEEMLNETEITSSKDRRKFYRKPGTFYPLLSDRKYPSAEDIFYSTKTLVFIIQHRFKFPVHR